MGKKATKTSKKRTKVYLRNKALYMLAVKKQKKLQSLNVNRDTTKGHEEDILANHPDTQPSAETGTNSNVPENPTEQTTLEPGTSAETGADNIPDNSTEQETAESPVVTESPVVKKPPKKPRKPRLTCRACLRFNARCCLNLRAYDTALQAFQDLAGIVMDPQDGLPQTVCDDCLTKLTEFAEFRKKIRLSQYLLEAKTKIQKKKQERKERGTIREELTLPPKEPVVVRKEIIYFQENLEQNPVHDDIINIKTETDNLESHLGDNNETEYDNLADSDITVKDEVISEKCVEASGNGIEGENLMEIAEDNDTTRSSVGKNNWYIQVQHRKNTQGSGGGGHHLYRAMDGVGFGQEDIVPTDTGGGAPDSDAEGAGLVIVVTPYGQEAVLHEHMDTNP